MRKEFPDDDTCLDKIFIHRYGKMKACPKCGVVRPTYYRVRKRTAYECKDCRHQIYPLVGTIFEKTTTPLTDWFHAIYLFSVSKNGVAATEIERQVGVSYKTAHRMAKQIRLLMHEAGKLGFLGTPIEIDEAYIGGRQKQGTRDRKTPVMAALEVGGHVRTGVIPRVTAKYALPFIDDNVFDGSTIHTDEAKIYKHKTIAWKYRHDSVRHIAEEFVRDGVTTNHVEAFFGQLKRSLNGTYHSVSPQYLASYVAEFAYRYNYRNEVIFPRLLARAAMPIR